MRIDLPKSGNAQVEICGRSLRLTNLDKILWPQTGFTKGDMMRYYLEVSPFLLNHIAGRPLTLKRAPNGVEDWYWFQTSCPHPPDWLPTRRVSAAGGDGKYFDYCVVEDLASLVWVINLAAIELHPLLSTTGADEDSEVIVFDFDPGYPSGMAECCEVAVAVRPILEGEGITPLLKTSGLAGLHVYGVLAEPQPFTETRTMARSIAADLSSRLSGLVTTNRSLGKRRGRVFIDWSQNSPLRSMVAPYSLRAAAIPTVSTPVTWEEVQAAIDHEVAGGLVFSPPQVVSRAQRLGDLFRPPKPLPAGSASE